MGCISSKVLTRSRSLQEELNQNFQRTADGFPVLEELLISKKGGDKFLALVCTTNTVTKKLRTGNFDSQVNEEIIKPSTETLNAWELISNLEEAQDQKPQENQHLPTTMEHFYDVINKRSKSFHWSPEYFESSSNISCSEIKGNTGIVRSRSFHTVQEFDALIEKGWLSKAREANKPEDSVTKAKFEVSDARANSSRRYHNVQENETHEVKEKCKSYLGGKGDRSVVEEKRTVGADKLENSGLELTKAFPNGMWATEEISLIEEGAIDRNVVVTDKGRGRKAMAKELAALQTPSTTIDFPATASLKGSWQVYSPGAYITPKFGSFSYPAQENGRKCDEEGGSSVFHPEIVAAFEVSMQQPEAEEQCVLKQIVENLEEANEEIEAGEDKISFNIQE